MFLFTIKDAEPGYRPGTFFSSQERRTVPHSVALALLISVPRTEKVKAEGYSIHDYCNRDCDTRNMRGVYMRACVRAVWGGVRENGRKRRRGEERSARLPFPRSVRERNVGGASYLGRALLRGPARGPGGDSRL